MQSIPILDLPLVLIRTVLFIATRIITYLLIIFLFFPFLNPTNLLFLSFVPFTFHLRVFFLDNCFLAYLPRWFIFIATIILFTPLAAFRELRPHCKCQMRLLNSKIQAFIVLSEECLRQHMELLLRLQGMHPREQETNESFL